MGCTILSFRLLLDFNSTTIFQGWNLYLKPRPQLYAFALFAFDIRLNRILPGTEFHFSSSRIESILQEGKLQWSGISAHEHLTSPFLPESLLIHHIIWYKHTIFSVIIILIPLHVVRRLGQNEVRLLTQRFSWANRMHPPPTFWTQYHTRIAKNPSL